MKIGLYGGAFDPIHIGHIAVAKAAKKFGMDKVILIPTGNMPHKSGCQALAEDRINMLRLAIDDEDFLISDYEAQRTEISYSSDTVKHFKEIYPDDELYFIIGDDSYDYIDAWHEPQVIFDNATVLVYPREGVKVLPPAIELKCEIVNVSSSEIRDKIKKGKSVKEYLTYEVYQYIEAKNIYK